MDRGERSAQCGGQDRRAERGRNSQSAQLHHGALPGRQSKKSVDKHSKKEPREKKARAIKMSMK